MKFKELPKYCTFATTDGKIFTRFRENICHGGDFVTNTPDIREFFGEEKVTLLNFPLSWNNLQEHTTVTHRNFLLQWVRVPFGNSKKEILIFLQSTAIPYLTDREWKNLVKVSHSPITEYWLDRFFPMLSIGNKN